MELHSRTLACGPYILSGTQNHRARSKTAVVRKADFYQIAVVEDGAVPYRLDGGLCKPEAPYALFVEPGTDIHVSLPRGVTWHMLCFDAVHQTRRSLAENASDVRVGASVHTTAKRQPPSRKVWGVSLPLEIPRDILADCVSTVRWCNAHWWRAPTDYARANHHLGLMLLDLADSAAKSVAHPHDWLGTLKQHCAEAMVHGISVGDLARSVGVSRQQLRNRLLAECDMTPKEFTDHLRIEEACRLLRATPAMIRDIGKSCGYASLPVFTRRFRKYTGQSPTRWRRMHQSL